VTSDIVIGWHEPLPTAVYALAVAGVFIVWRLLHRVIR
jgi:hypothetical protein